MDWSFLLTLAAVGLMFYLMMRHGGGCCGGGHSRPHEGPPKPIAEDAPPPDREPRGR